MQRGSSSLARLLRLPLSRMPSDSCDRDYCELLHDRYCPRFNARFQWNGACAGFFVHPDVFGHEVTEVVWTKKLRVRTLFCLCSCWPTFVQGYAFKKGSKSQSGLQRSRASKGGCVEGGDFACHRVPDRKP